MAGARRLVACACVAVLASCAGDDERAPPAPVIVRPATTGPTTLPSPPRDESTTIRVLTPGAEPRAPLRYRPVVGDEQVLAVDSRIALAMTSNGNRMFGRDDPSKGRIRLHVEKIDGDRITIGLLVEAMEAPNYDPTERALSIVGERGTFTVTDRGQIVATNLPFLEVSDAARDVLELSDYVLQLPSEPVGVGATWEVHSILLRNGIGLRATETYELLEVTSTAARTRARLDQEAWQQVVSEMTEDPITVFEVAAFRSSGASETRLAFAQVMPEATEIHFEFATEMQIRDPGSTQNITLTTDATIRTRTERRGRPAR